MDINIIRKHEKQTPFWQTRVNTKQLNQQNPQNSESAHFPLLYHLLLLRNYYHNSQHFYRTESYPADQPQPLDLSVKAKEEYLSAFTKERKKISCDESIQDIEEVEVVYKDDKVKPESVKEFVERKIKEYKKAEENFESHLPQLCALLACTWIRNMSTVYM